MVSTAIFLAGMATEFKFHLAAETLQAQKETEKAQDGQNKIIDFHQQIQKVYVKDKEPCLSKPLPADIKRLLK